MDQQGILESESNSSISKVLSAYRAEFGQGMLAGFQTTHCTRGYSTSYINCMYLQTTFGVLKHTTEANVKT